jgi:hypothetical protein
LTVITLRKAGEVMVAAFPDTEKLKQAAYEHSLWFARVNNDPEKEKENISVRIDIKKTNEVYEKDEKSHETDHYEVTIVQDTAYLPSDTDISLVPDFERMDISLDLHYSSKYAQNSATTLEIAADIRQADSIMKIQGKMKTAAPWLFMPFEIIDPVQAGTDKAAVLEPYFTDWISNAASMIHHTATESVEGTDAAEIPAENSEPPQEADEASSQEDTGEPDMSGSDAETAPLDIPEQ